MFALAQNGTWAPVTVKLMTEKISTLKNVTIVDESLAIKSALHKNDRESLERFADAIIGA